MDMQRSWDIKPPRWVACGTRGLGLAKPDEPFFLFDAADRLMSDAGVGGEWPNVARAKEAFLVHDEANPHRREGFLFPIADVGSDGVRRVYFNALESAQRALLQGPAGEAVQAEAQGVLDHYMRRFGAVQKGEPDPFASATVALDQRRCRRRLTAPTPRWGVPTQKCCSEGPPAKRSCKGSAELARATSSANTPARMRCERSWLEIRRRGARSTI
jgi:hypothetical protein